MKTTPDHDKRMASMTLASVYPHYVTKVERKGRTKSELHKVIKWLTGFDGKQMQKFLKEEVTFKVFFKQAKLNPNAHLIIGTICGYRIEEIKNPITRQVRYLDKLVDELANGKSMEKVLRKENKSVVKTGRPQKMKNYNSFSEWKKDQTSKNHMKNTATDFRHKIPKDLAKTLTESPKLTEKWEELTPLARNEWICYVTIVKKPETRSEHLLRLKEDLLKGKKRPCCWPGCPHRRPKAAKWFQM